MYVCILDMVVHKSRSKFLLVYVLFISLYSIFENLKTFSFDQRMKTHIYENLGKIKVGNAPNLAMNINLEKKQKTTHRNTRFCP